MDRLLGKPIKICTAMAKSISPVHFSQSTLLSGFNPKPDKVGYLTELKTCQDYPKVLPYLLRHPRIYTHSKFTVILLTL